MYHIENFISERGEAYLQEYTWGYTTCTDLSNIDRLVRLRKVKDFYDIQQRYGGECLTKDEVDCLNNEIRTLTLGCDPNTPNYTVDLSKRDFWVVQNAGCVQVPHYIKYCESLVCNLEFGKISVEDVTAICNISLDIYAEEMSCDLKANIFAVQQNCDVDYVVSVSEESCEIQHNTLVTEMGCDISLDDYKNKVKALIKK